MNFQAFAEDIRKNQWNVFGVEVYQKGVLRESYGDTAENRHPIYSATKSIVSIGMGMAIEEGKIDIEKSILSYMPGEFLADLPAEQRKAFQNITVERLLTMSVSGFPFRAEGSSFLQFALNCKLDRTEERAFNYSNIPAYLAGVALTNALEEDLYLYLKRKLFEPLQIGEPAYERCPDGYFYGASGMQLTVRELSRIGMLLYNGGAYEGQRLLTGEYVKLATGVRQMNREGGYGYYFWKYRDGFSINGKWGQKCYILPKEEIIVTFLSHIEEDTLNLRNSMEKNILGV